MHYSIPGTSQQLCGPADLMPAGAILMQYERPTPESIAQPDGTWITPLGTVVNAKRAEIIAKSDAAMASLTSDYSSNEKLSWPKQEAEAKALLADTNAAAPLLSAIAAGRGITLMALRDKVLANVALSEAITGAVLGQQQAYEDRVKAATTVEEVEAIIVEYTLPTI